MECYKIKQVFVAFDSQLKNGNIRIVIEHNLESIKCADWIIDMGPEGGNQGGEIIFQGLPEDLIKEKRSITSKFLKEKLGLVSVGLAIGLGEKLLNIILSFALLNVFFNYP